MPRPFTGGAEAANAASVVLPAFAPDWSTGALVAVLMILVLNAAGRNRERYTNYRLEMRDRKRYNLENVIRASNRRRTKMVNLETPII